LGLRGLAGGKTLVDISGSDDEPQTVSVYVNDSPRSVPVGTTLAALILEVSPRGDRGVAVAINDSVVPRAAWANRALADGERILVIQASQGG
jgi:sulfur carrier protein